MSFRWVKESVESPFEEVEEEEEEPQQHASLVPCYNWVYVEEDEEKDDGGVQQQHQTDGGEDYDDDMRHLDCAQDQLGSVLWNSNTTVLRWMKEHLFNSEKKNTSSTISTTAGRSPLHGLRIVELGAGVGVLGIALARAGAHVAVTDMKELVPLMHENCLLSRDVLLGRKGRRGGGVGKRGGRVGAFAWKWGDPYPQRELQMCFGTSSSSSSEQEDPTKLLPGGVIEIPCPLATGNKKKNEKGMNRINKQKKRRTETKTVLDEAGKKEVEKTTTCGGHDNDDDHIRGGGGGGKGYYPLPLPHHKPIDYVVMVDALYGNPKEWPKLIRTLSEIVERSPHCKIINFCEQRVENHEDAFLDLLMGKSNENDTDNMDGKEEQCSKHKNNNSYESSSGAGGTGGSGVEWVVSSVATLKETSNLEMPIRVSVIEHRKRQRCEKGVVVEEEGRRGRSSSSAREGRYGGDNGRSQLMKKRNRSTSTA